MSASQRRTVLVTGASSGIGSATALYMAEKGFAVIGTSRAQARLAGMEEETRRRRLPFTAVELDINSDSAVEDTLPRLISEHGAIDVLVNNAGYGLWGPAQSLSNGEIRAQMDTNFFAPFRLMKAVLPAMIERRSGTIVNVSSILGRIGTPFNGAYVASKFALEGLSESMRVELWPFGVRVALLEPGYIRTNFHENQVIAAQADSTDLPYGPYTEAYRSRRRTYAWLGTDPIKVAKTVHKIARSKRPRFRYSVNPEATMGALGARFMPERLFQSLLSRATMR